MNTIRLAIAQGRSKLTDAERLELAGRARQQLPVHICDQVEAASTQAETIVRQSAHQGSQKLAVLPPCHALKRRTDGFAAALATGELTGCGNVSFPQPCLATL